MNVVDHDNVITKNNTNDDNNICRNGNDYNKANSSDDDDTNTNDDKRKCDSQLAQTPKRLRKSLDKQQHIVNQDNVIINDNTNDGNHIGTDDNKDNYTNDNDNDNTNDEKRKCKSEFIQRSKRLRSSPKSYEGEL